MNVLDLFSGIGGFSLGLEAAGMHTVAFCEREPFCQAVLKKHWPDIPLHPDVRSLDGTEFRGTVDLVCGGYPCQPFSIAGRQLGTSDERHLWPEMLRIIRNVRPRWVVAENVGGHIKLGFDEVAASLEAEGFTVWPFVIPACAVDAPHRRDRLWIVGHAEHHGLSPPEKLRGDETAGVKRRQEKARQSAGTVEPPDVPGLRGCQGRGEPSADTDRLGQQRRGCLALQRKSGIALELERSAQKWSEGWPVSSPRICRVDDGIPDRTHRLRALGNAIVPQIAALIGQAIIQYEKENP